MKQNHQTVSPMSNEGRNSYVIRQITDATLALLAEKKLDDISVSELCEKAGVGRASFYRNFESREAVVRAYIHTIFSPLLEEQGQKGGPLHEQIRALFSHFEQHRPIYALLSERGLIYLLKDVLIGIYGPKKGCSKTEAYASAFVTYALYGWIEVWFQRGMQESADEMAMLFRQQGL